MTWPCFDRPEHVTRDTGDLDVGLIDEPASPDCVPARSGQVDQHWREALQRTEQGDVIDVDAAFREGLFEIAIRQPEPQIPTHRQHDHLRPEPEPTNAESSNGGTRRRRRFTVGPSPVACDPSTQQSRCEAHELRKRLDGRNDGDASRQTATVITTPVNATEPPQITGHIRGLTMSGPNVSSPTLPARQAKSHELPTSYWASLDA